MRPAHLLFSTFLSAGLLAGAPVFADTLTLSLQDVPEWKPVYAVVETRDRLPARARIGGTVSALDVTEGDRVEAGQRVAVIEDTKLSFQIEGIQAQLDAATSQMEQARADLERGQSLADRGVIANQRLEALQTAVNVLEGQITGLKAQQQVVSRQIEEGEVLAPQAGIVLSAPVNKGGVVFAGEQVAIIGSGGTFLRLQIPERFADSLREGDDIQITEGDGVATGTLAKIYPLVQGGRIEADVDVDDLDENFVGRRVQIRLPVASHPGLLVPTQAIRQSYGMDFVTVALDHRTSKRAIVPGGTVEIDGASFTEVLSGLSAGETVVTEDE